MSPIAGSHTCCFTTLNVSAQLMRRFLALGIALTLSSGCGGGSAPSRPTVQLSGKVMFGAKPLEDATIVFDPEDGKGAPASAPVEKGEYQVYVQTGPKLVRITSNRKSPEVQTSDTPPLPSGKDSVPDIYNTRTTLKKEVKEAETGVDFTLQPPKK